MGDSDRAGIKLCEWRTGDVELLSEFHILAIVVLTLLCVLFVRSAAPCREGGDQVPCRLDLAMGQVLGQRKGLCASGLEPVAKLCRRLTAGSESAPEHSTNDVDLLLVRLMLTRDAVLRP